jgi:hypothetical protein
MYYLTTIQLVHNLVETLNGKGTSERPKTSYLTVGSYMDEFWVLYHGEMAVVESEDVEKAMVAFGDTLRELDRVYYSQIEKALLAIAKVKPVDVDVSSNWNAAAKSYKLRSADAVSQMQLDHRRTELLEQPIERWANSFNPGETAKLATITAKLLEQRQKLKELLEKELKELSPLTVTPSETK